MPQPSRWGPVPPPRCISPVKLKQMSVGTLALMPSSSHMARNGTWRGDDVGDVSMREVRMRAAGPLDLAAVRSLGRRLFAARGDYGQAVAMMFRARGVRTVVAEDRELIGFVMFGEGHVHAIGVGPTAQRAGVGRALLRHALAEMAGREVRLEVARDAEAARALFEGEGFRPTGEGGTYPSGTPYDSLV